MPKIINGGGLRFEMVLQWVPIWLISWSNRLELVGWWYSYVSFLTCMLLASLCVGIAFGSIPLDSCPAYISLEGCMPQWLPKLMYETSTTAK